MAHDCFSPQQPNGSWTGMMNMTAEGSVDVTVAGFVWAVERKDAVDFSDGIVTTHTSLYISSDIYRDRLSINNFMYEFGLRTWLAILATAVATALVYFVSIVVTRPRGFGFSDATSVVLRSLISRGTTTFKPSRISTRILLLSNLIFALVVVQSYRSCMNAFLAITVPSSNVKNLEDVEQTGRRLTFWAGSGMELYLQRAPPGSTLSKLYYRSIADERAAFTSYEQGFRNVLDDRDYVMVGDDQLVNPYPCEVTKVSKYIFTSTKIYFIFPRGSSLVKPFNYEIVRMKQHGVNKTILKANPQQPLHNCIIKL